MSEIIWCPFPIRSRLASIWLAMWEPYLRAGSPAWIGILDRVHRSRKAFVAERLP